MLMLMQFCDCGHHRQLCGTVATVNGGGGDAGHLSWWLRSLLTGAMVVFVIGDSKGGLGQGRTWSRMDSGEG